MRESLGFEGKGLIGFAFSGSFRSGEMASWRLDWGHPFRWVRRSQLALRWSGLLNVGQAASLPIRSAVRDSLFEEAGIKPAARKSTQGACAEPGGQGHRRKERAVGERDAIPSSQATYALVAESSRLSAWRERRTLRSSILRQESRGRFGRPDFSVVVPLFLHRRKTRKIEKSRGFCAKIVQRSRAGHLGK